jgi:HD-like signal output (HDOD) protein/GAF domain-containing protein
MANAIDSAAARAARGTPASDEARRARDKLLNRISTDGNLPAVGSLILRIVQIASSDGEAVHNLATFVLSDVALTQKILRIANTVGYRAAAGKQVTTISKAIFVLGFETIKTTALALLLVDSMQGKRGESVRNELSYALAASAVARELAQRSHYRDNEEAAVAALFMNIGQVLTASYDHLAYKQVETLIKAGRTVTQASMQVMGCSYAMLADAVLRDWKIPDSIVLGMASLPDGVLKLAKSRQEWMQQVAGFSTAAAELVLNPPPRGERKPFRMLLARYGAALQIDQEGLDLLMAAATRETRLLSGGADLATLTENLVRRQKKIAAGEDPAAGEPGEGGEEDQEQDGSPDPAALKKKDMGGLPEELLLEVKVSNADDPIERYPSGKPINARELLLTGVQDVVEMMSSGRCKLNDLIMLVLETLYHGLGCRFATICLKDAKTGLYRARISLGEKHEARQSGFVYPASTQRDIFFLAMENDADLLISDAFSPKISKLIPLWHKTLLPDARSFIVLPLIVRGKPVGFFYADRRRPADEGVPADETALIKTLKGQVLVALNNHAA